MEAIPRTAALRKLDRRNVQGEYYITDCAEILQRGGERIAVFRCDQREEARASTRSSGSPPPNA